MKSNRTVTSRRNFLIAAAATILAPSVNAATPTRPLVEVWKDPNCGCCGDWIAHLENNGFEARVAGSNNAEMRERLSLPVKYGSCHTAKVGGYAVEGHVPAREIRRLLREKPKAVGLAVPGMPIGSPGMDGPAYNGRSDRYDVLLVQRDGTARVYQSYP